MISQVMDRKAHHPIMWLVVWEDFLPWGGELNLNGLDGFGKLRCEDSLSEKEDEGSRV